MIPDSPVDGSSKSAPPPHDCALLVEDSSQDTWLIRRALDATGRSLRLTNTRHGEEAVAYLSGVGVYADRSEYPVPSVVLLDLKLPRLNGFEVLSWLREHGGLLKKLPVVVLSSSDEPKDIQRAYELGANGYVVKPCSKDSLKHSLESICSFWLDENRAPVATC